MNWQYIYLIGVLVQLTPCYSYRILAIYPLNGRSHFYVFVQVAKALAEKGHQVDVISGFPLKEKFPNYNDLITLPSSNKTGVFDFNAVKQQELLFKTVHKQFQSICRLLEHPDISNLIHNPPDPPYDAILTQAIGGYVCFNAIGHLWNVPVISVSTTMLYPFYDHFIGTPLNLAASSRNYRIYKENMTFWDRLYNFVMTHYFIGTYISEGKVQGDITNKYFDDKLPDYTVLQKSISLILANSHHSLYGIRPKVPALVEIGGIHINDDNSTIPSDLKLVMDRSKNGFIYVSFGSHIVVETLPKDVVNKLFVVYEKLAPIQVLMKTENPAYLLNVSIPKNVHFFSWLPQLKILQHHNIKAFVTHGGGLSIQEAVHFGVAVICIPVYGDQIINCDIATSKKIGLKLDITTAKQEDYFNIFSKIVNDPTFTKASKKLSLLYRDRLKSPREEATYWVEYVIRHGKNALRSPTVDLEWWQVELLDVLVFIGAAILLIMIIATFVIKQLCRFILSRTKIQLNFVNEIINKKIK